MKTRNSITVLFIALAILTLSCEDDFSLINGEGRITTETLTIPEFTGIQLTGIDDVHISYGSSQHVEVTGHPNIIARIKKQVINDTWYMELERGNYGRYELTYYITLPRIDNAGSNGTGNIIVDGPFVQDQIDIRLEGTGSFKGFSLESAYCTVDITGTGNCEVTATESLDVRLDGSGSVYYRGYPLLNADISGLGRVVNAN